jgi:AraC-like DNA-binding protein
MNILAPLLTTRLHLLGAEYFKMNSPRPSRFISRRVWVLELIMKGQLQVNVENDDWMTLGENSGIIYAPGTRYREKVPSSGTICHSVGLFFETGTLPRSAPWDRFHEPYLETRDEEKLLLPLVESSLGHLGLSVPDDVRATADFLGIIAHLLRAEMRGKILIIAGGHPGGDMVARAHQYMRKRLGKPLQLTEIANAVGMSVSGFAHHYKRQTGISPMTMLRRMRVEAVKSHLMRERLTLGQIAVETGFADAFHLSRTFKEITGVSPREFRRNAGAGLTST